MNERRSSKRYTIDPPAIGMMHIKNIEDPDRIIYFVEVHNISDTGILIASDSSLPEFSSCEVEFKMPGSSDWQVAECEMNWEAVEKQTERTLWGMNIKNLTQGHLKNGYSLGDFEFLLNISFLEALPRKNLCRILNCLEKRTFEKGETIIKQGAAGDCLYVIQSGVCRVEVETDGKTHHLILLRQSEVMGEMGVITGEPRTATVRAIEDTVAWRLDREDFELLAEEQPELRAFLTELVANRLESSPITANRVVGKYVIQGMLGASPWNIVYSGIHSTLSLPVTIKMLRHDLAMQPYFQDSFLREAKIIADLSHPNIVQVFDIEKRYNTVFMIMEKLEGHPLNTILKRTGPLPAGKAATILSQICLGLRYAHQQGIVHRDIRPANIFIQQNGKVKLLNFGLKTMLQDASSRLTESWLYTPPERTPLYETDGRFDIYSLGIVAYEMLVGKHPFPGVSKEELAHLYRTQEMQDPADERSDIPSILREFILTCCKRDPRQRYTDMGEALAALSPLSRQDYQVKNRKMSAVYLFYPEEHQKKVKKILEGLEQEAKAIGVELRSSEIRNI